MSLRTGPVLGTALRLLRVGVVAAIALAVGVSSARAAGEGSVRFVRATSASFDRYTDSSDPLVHDWINQHMWRMLVYSSYFDDKTSWYPGGWMYKDLYAVYRESSIAGDHPDWVLRDSHGNPLYIPWGCSNGACPQYAGDPGNPAFRQWWIDQARTHLAHGYKGLWIDDVNLELRVSDGTGTTTAPIDPRTGTTMTATAWRTYMADFTEQIRHAFPNIEIVHNALWFAAPDRTDDPQVRREITAADYINLERGANDDGLTGGTGQWSLHAFLAYIDTVHTLGTNVILEGTDPTPTGREYNLAAYLLTTNATDAISAPDMTPENWWTAYDTTLGDATGPRYTWQNLTRRDYTNGTTLLNPPNNPTRTITLPAPLLDARGRLTTAVTLAPRQGAVLHGPASPLLSTWPPSPDVAAGGGAPLGAADSPAAREFGGGA